jgi:hypothetical protein
MLSDPTKTVLAAAEYLAETNIRHACAAEIEIKSDV